MLDYIYAFNPQTGQVKQWPASARDQLRYPWVEGEVREKAPVAAFDDLASLEVEWNRFATGVEVSDRFVAMFPWIYPPRPTTIDYHDFLIQEHEGKWLYVRKDYGAGDKPMVADSEEAAKAAIDAAEGR